MFRGPSGQSCKINCVSVVCCRRCHGRDILPFSHFMDGRAGRGILAFLDAQFLLSTETLLLGKANIEASENALQFSHKWNIEKKQGQDLDLHSILYPGLRPNWLGYCPSPSAFSWLIPQSSFILMQPAAPVRCFGAVATEPWLVNILAGPRHPLQKRGTP